MLYCTRQNLNGEVGVEHVEAGVDEEVVDADRHQSRIKLELHIDQLKFDFDQWARKFLLMKENSQWAKKLTQNCAFAPVVSCCGFQDRTVGL